MDYSDQRRKMVEIQLSARGISDGKVLRAFMSVPRHNFVHKDRRNYSYDDNPLPIGEGQTISQPYMVALMTEVLALAGGETVLEIGTGSGYQTAILAEICSKVVTMERSEELLLHARNTLTVEGYENVEFVFGDGTKGCPDKGPFDAIIVTAGAPEVPEPLKRQLKNGGRLVIPVGNLYSQTLILVEKEKSGFSTVEICGCQFVPLIGEYGWKV